ncbi:MAG: hypothetical protein COV45_00050 [Deltaproteobacteria bacterium CG11_big_fil_rev_8_21_14_0_20_47_16]|nr:MAG: hypothetical protein COV45_00050 [Deltaproteobacteria bacterium CG11_big_fil_rev_8_21_14_0_20_47_16]
MTLLQNQLHDAAASLVADFTKTSSYKNPNTNGSIKEDLIRKELMQRLPSGIEFGKGEIVDTFGNRTGEHDIVGYDKHFMPLFQSHGTISTFFSESVFCCVEAKSFLDEAALKDAKKKFDSIAQLKRVYEATSLSHYMQTVIGIGGFSGTLTIPGRDNNINVPKMVTAVFAISGLKNETISNHLITIKPNADLVCILDKGVWGRKHDSQQWICACDRPELTYYTFIVLLHELLHPHLLRHLYARVNLAKYV